MSKMGTPARPEQRRARVPVLHLSHQSMAGRAIAPRVSVIGINEVTAISAGMTLNAAGKSALNQLAALIRGSARYGSVWRIFDPVPITMLGIIALRLVHDGDGRQGFFVVRVIFFDDDRSVARFVRILNRFAVGVHSQKGAMWRLARIHLGLARP